LAKPKWIWFDEEEKNGGNFNDEVLTREKGRDEENLKEWKKAYDRSEGQAKRQRCGSICIHGTKTSY
jgi:hypothetical protein